MGRRCYWCVLKFGESFCDIAAAAVVLSFVRLAQNGEAMRAAFRENVNLYLENNKLDL